MLGDLLLNSLHLHHGCVMLLFKLVALTLDNIQVAAGYTVHSLFLPSFTFVQNRKLLACFCRLQRRE